ncbi:MAG: Wzt carbohydrate-binding domain-containing protein [Methylococcaceae bacterium]|nr:Wzt carbohydrate-binding domain-containing protein [Methylococcaceae bacterium]
MVELVSVHIPKTAGSSFYNSLVSVYGEPFVYRYDDDKPIPNQCRVVHGHFCANRYINEFTNAKWIAWVRHPVARLLSFYFYKLYTEHAAVGKFEDFIQRQDITNEQAALLTGKNLTDYFFIGVQEFYAVDFHDLSTSLKWPDVKIDRTNVNLNGRYRNEVQRIISSRNVMKELISRNHDDMELYSEVMFLRAKRRKEDISKQYFWVSQNNFFDLDEGTPGKDSQYGDGTFKGQVKKSTITKARIKTVQLLNSRLISSDSFYMGEAMTVSSSVFLLLPMDEVVVGFSIKDEQDCEVYGTNTELLADLSGSNYSSGLLTVDFVVNLNLNYGKYNLTIEVHSPCVGREDITYYDWWEGCKYFEVRKPDPGCGKSFYVGTSLLPAKVIIKNGDKVAYGSNNYFLNNPLVLLRCLLYEPLRVKVGQRIVVPLEIVNLGFDVMDSLSLSNPVFISHIVTNGEDVDTISDEDKISCLQQPVLPNEKVGCEIYVKAPLHPGSYTLAIGVISKSCCYGDEDLTKPIALPLVVSI